MPANHKNKLNFTILLVALLCVVMYLGRRFDVISNPQFYAEDGTVCFAQAHNEGALMTLLKPYNGTTAMLCRLGGSYSTFFPLKLAPLANNVLAILLQLLPVFFFLSNRFEHIIKAQKNRALIAIAYCLAPNTVEIYANLANTQWHLLIFSFLVLVAKPATSKAIYYFETTILLLTALCGPFSIFLTILSTAVCYKNRTRLNLYRLALLSSCALITIYLLTSGSFGDRPKILFEFNLLGFMQVISGKVFLSSLIGFRGFRALSQSEHWNIYSAIVPNLIGSIVIYLALRRSSYELKLFALLAAMILFSALISPTVPDIAPHWQILAKPGTAGRYWFIPAICFYCCIFNCIKTYKHKFVLTTCYTLVLVLTYGVYRDYFYPRSHVSKFT